MSDSDAFTALTHEELMTYSKRQLADTILSHIPHLDLLRQERAKAEIRVAELEAERIDLLVEVGRLRSMIHDGAAKDFTSLLVDYGNARLAGDLEARMKIEHQLGICHIHRSF